MASKIELQTEFNVGFEALWNALTKDKLDVLHKAAPHLLTDSQVLEGDGGLGTLVSIKIGDAAAHIPPFKEKIVEFDEAGHFVSFQGIEGGFLQLGFASYKVSFKLDDLEENKTLVKTTINYELDKEIDGTTQVVKDITNIIGEYLKALASYLENSA
ncbi:Ribonuclease 1 [Dendrobium catenatum]|uniref:Ribonuclease 1 n=1 Tax=Dendrobium catenatum TaxID=906689 RepID=A0A2I0X9M6_9ASPA|nr:Ribonuclease 1 [Dendrobium catenatum]